MLLLQQEQLLDATVDIVAGLIPRVTGVVLLDIRPAVGQVPANTSLIPFPGVKYSKGRANVHFTSLRMNIGKCIEHMRQLLGGQILWVVVAPVDGLQGGVNMSHSLAIAHLSAWQREPPDISSMK